MDVIDTGETRFKDETHLWAFKDFPERALRLSDKPIVREVSQDWREIL